MLLTEKKTDVIHGFVAKTGMMFDAPLKLTDEGKIEFDFPQKQEPTDTSLSCPKCKKMLKKTQWMYECECGFKISHTVARVELSEDTMRELFEKGRTKDKLTGFASRTGKLFDARLKLSEDKIAFDFDA